jgi:hypothetical protein
MARRAHDVHLAGLVLLSKGLSDYGATTTNHPKRLLGTFACVVRSGVLSKPSDVAERLGISTVAVYKAIRAGDSRVLRLGSAPGVHGRERRAAPGSSRALGQG